MTDRQYHLNNLKFLLLELEGQLTACSDRLTAVFNAVAAVEADEAEPIQQGLNLDSQKGSVSF